MGEKSISISLFLLRFSFPLAFNVHLSEYHVSTWPCPRPTSIALTLLDVCAISTRSAMLKCEYPTTIPKFLQSIVIPGTPMHFPFLSVNMHPNVFVFLYVRGYSSPMLEGNENGVPRTQFAHRRIK